MSTSTWGASLEDSGKNVLAFCSTMGSATLTRTLNAPAELQCEFAINGPDTAALFTQLASGAVYLRVAEDGVSRFFGVLTDLQADVADSSTITATFADLVQQYATSYYYFSVGGGWNINAGYDGSGTQATLVTNLMTDFTGMSSVLLPLAVSGSASGSRIIEPQDGSRLDILNMLATVQGGIDYYVVADQTLKIANTLGSDVSESVVFQLDQLGQSNVLSASVQYLPPRNQVFTNRNNGFFKTTRTSSSSVSAFGDYTTIVQRLERGTATETDVADQLLRTSWRQTLGLDLEPSVCPRPWTDFDLGDQVRVSVVTDAFTVNSVQRISQIVHTFDAQLVEVGLSVSLEVK